MKQGAEAVVEFKDDVIVKKRLEKNYRHPELDSRLREKRTESEIELMQEAGRYGANVPEVEQKSEFALDMERIHGELLKDSIDKRPAAGEKLGENVAFLHSAGIIHGDLTTSNAILKDGELYLIDFGLSFRSERTEDRAVDLHLLKQVLESSHPDITEEFWNRFLEGYREYEGCDEVIEQLKEVEQRGRYK